MKTMKKIKIYANETCPYCKKIKEKLTDNNIKFDVVMTGDNSDEWQSIVDLTGMGMVPTIFFNNEYLVPGRDFSSEESLMKLIENQKPSKFTKEERLFEKLKTLTFNIHGAFTRTQQLLTDIQNNTEIKNAKKKKL